jgi:hypothetical protein
MCEGQTITRVARYSTGGVIGTIMYIVQVFREGVALSGDSLGDVKISMVYK